MDDPRYLEFLDRLATPLAERLAAGARGLDYGSGPAPGMAALFERHGFRVTSWDPLFPSDTSALSGAYDFVTCSEVLEHIPQPNDALDRMASLLPRGGWIGIMTQFRRDEADFARWWYRRDPTHVCFYSEQTMRWIGARRGWAVEVPAANVSLFRLLPSAG